MGLATTLECIADEERRIGIKIPNNVKSLLLSDNGGSECISQNNPDEIWNLFAVKDMTSREHVKRSANHIERETLSAFSWRGFPKNVIAIGSNGCGDYLIVKNQSCKIFIWRHETGKSTEVLLIELT